jgi:hypothetical protein
MDQAREDTRIVAPADTSIAEMELQAFLRRRESEATANSIAFHTTQEEKWLWQWPLVGL